LHADQTAGSLLAGTATQVKQQLLVTLAQHQIKMFLQACDPLQQQQHCAAPHMTRCQLDLEGSIATDMVRTSPF
jgi:hypothetical protein